MKDIEQEGRDRTRAYLKPKVWGWMMKELELWDGQDHLLDSRDVSSFVEGLQAEVAIGEAMQQFPVVAYEEFSASTEKPRTAHLLEALKFLNMSGKVAFINDCPAPAPRKGFLAQILVV